MQHLTHPVLKSGLVRWHPWRLLTGGVLSLGLLAVAGCQNITVDSAAAAEVRFVNTSMDAPPFDMYVSGTGAAYNLGYATFTSYVALSPGEYQLKANRAGTTQALANAHVTLAGARQYTAVIGNVLGGLQETLYPDQKAPAPAGMMAVRVLQESSGAGPLSIYLVPNGGSASSTTPLAADLGYAASSGYVNIPAGTSYSVAVLTGAPGAHATLLSGVAVPVSSGAVHTLVIGDAPVGSKERLCGFVLDDVDVR